MGLIFHPRKRFLFERVDCRAWSLCALLNNGNLDCLYVVPVTCATRTPTVFSPAQPTNVGNVGAIVYVIGFGRTARQLYLNRLQSHTRTCAARLGAVFYPILPRVANIRTIANSALFRSSVHQVYLEGFQAESLALRTCNFLVVNCILPTQ